MVVIAASPSRLQGQPPSLSIEQQLRSQYRISSVGANGVAVRTGSVLVVAEDGIKANPPSGGTYWYNSHKPGDRIKYSVVFESLQPVDLRNQLRRLVVGAKVFVMQIDVKASELAFYVQTCDGDADGVRYRAAVLFQFPQKNFVQPANLKAIQDSIAEVFAIDTAIQKPQFTLDQVAGLYVMAQAPDNQLQLHADGTLSLVQGGQNYSGTFTIQGNKVIGQVGTGAPQQEGTLQGDTLIDPSGSAWVKQKAPRAQLKLPATYVSVQTPTDQFQLNADYTFSLQEAGQPYRGTFVVNGNTLEINISDGPKTTATIQGKNLTDSSGQTWVLREQPVQPANADVLKNQDVISLVKAGLDDSIIITKIGSSRCLFDTSTDALIRLKQSGVSAAVLKAMMGAGK